MARNVYAQPSAACTCACCLEQRVCSGRQRSTAQSVLRHSPPIPITYSSPLKTSCLQRAQHACCRPCAVRCHKCPSPCTASHQCLQFLLKRQLGGKYLYPVHRLDRATSGVVVYALSAEAAAAFGAGMRARRVQKVYYALVRGYTDTCGEWWLLVTMSTDLTPMAALNAILPPIKLHCKKLQTALLVGHLESGMSHVQWPGTMTPNTATMLVYHDIRWKQNITSNPQRLFALLTFHTKLSD